MNKFDRKLLRQKKAQERASKRLYDTIFKNEINLVIESYMGNLGQLINQTPLLVGQSSNSIAGATRKTWGSCGDVFGYEARDQTLQNSKSLRGLRLKDATQQQWDEVFTQNAINYVNTLMPEKVASILGTQSTLIQNELTRILATSINEGLSIDQITKIMDSSFKKWGYNMADYRSRTIARTEVNSASNWSRTNGAESIGEPLEKLWSTSGLQNVRESHLKCQAQGWIDKDITFINGLKFCGDQSSGNIGETINCRCSIQYRVKLL